MSNSTSNVYADLIRKSPINQNIKLAVSDRKVAWDEQGGKCYICKKDLNKFYLKYVKFDGKTRALCMDCCFKEKLN